MWTQAGKLLLILAASIILIGVFYGIRSARTKRTGDQSPEPSPAPQP
jgi:hypothetical protein